MREESSNDSIREKLQETVGVLPCYEWLDACVEFLSSSSNNNAVDVTADQVLYQILNTDLRSVVRSPINNNNNSTNDMPLAVRQVMAAIHAASQTNNDDDSRHHQTLQLTGNSRLLLQVEELLDVSRNAETHYVIGPASPSNPQPVGNQKMRCLKLCLTHGHYAGNNTNNSVLIGMEESVIANLSANTLAGAKILLHGTVTVRLGVLLLNEGNTTVLGGCVEELVQVQKRALEQAKQQAGVDPTIRALIGTNPIQDTQEDEPEDEAHEESGDVPTTPRNHPTVPNVPTPTPTTNDTVMMDVEPPQPRRYNNTMPAPEPRTQRQSRLSIDSNNNNSTTNNSRLSTDSTSSFQTAASFIYDSSPATTPTNAASSNSRPTSGASTANQQRNPHSTGNPYQVASSSNRMATPTTNAASNNPYATSARTITSTTSNSTNPYTTSAFANTSNNAKNPYAPGNQTTLAPTTAAATTDSTSDGPQPFIPYAASNTTSSNATNRKHNPYQSSSSHSPSADKRNPSTVPPPNDLTPRNMSISTRTSVPMSDITTSPHISNPAQPRRPLARQQRLPDNDHDDVNVDNSVMSVDVESSIMSNEQNLSPNSPQPTLQNTMTFPNLLRLLEQLVQNREMYESYYPTLSVKVNLQQAGSGLDFHPGKVENYKKLKLPKYQMVLSATFAGVQEKNNHKKQYLACQIDPTLVEPYFDKTATELRAMQKSNREQAQRVADVGGIRVREALFPQRYWKARLLPKPEKVFGNSTSGNNKTFALDDAKEPILFLQLE